VISANGVGLDTYKMASTAFTQCTYRSARENQTVSGMVIKENALITPCSYELINRNVYYAILNDRSMCRPTYRVLGVYH